MWAGLFDGAAHAKQEDEALQYVAHRPREGASVRGAAHGDYTRRRLARAQIDGPLNDPNLVRAVRERPTWRSCDS